MTNTKTPPTARRDESRDLAVGVVSVLALCQQTIDRLHAVGWEESQAIRNALDSLTDAKVNIERFVQLRNS